MVFGIFPKSWNYNHGLIHEYFITILKKQKQNKFMLLAVAPIHLTPNSWQSPIYFLFWVSSILNHTTGGLLCLTSFTKHSVSKVYPCCSRHQPFVPFSWLNIIPLSGYSLFCLSIYQWWTYSLMLLWLPLIMLRSTA